MYDMLEIQLFNLPGLLSERDSLEALQDALEPYYELQPLEHVAAQGFAPAGQVVRIAAAIGQRFESAHRFEAEVRELVGSGFAWRRVGVVAAEHETALA